jgi:hypothetical protein
MEGADKGFVRISLDPGYNMTGTRTAVFYSSVWQSITVAKGNFPEGDVDATLGTTTLTALAPVPEPTAALFGGLIASALGLTVARRPLQRD